MRRSTSRPRKNRAVAAGGCAVAALLLVTGQLALNPAGSLFWLCVAVLMVVVASSAWLSGGGTLRQTRLRQGRCAHCGYDLRGTRGRCPECGKLIAPGTPRRPA